MKNLKYLILPLLATLQLTCITHTRGQYMPMVFDKLYGEETRIVDICCADNDELVVVFEKGGNFSLSWLDRLGDVVFSKELDHFTEINVVKQVNGNCILLGGQSRVRTENNKKPGRETSGRALVLSPNGYFQHDYHVGGANSTVIEGDLLRNGYMLLGGSEFRPDGTRRGMLAKLSPDGTQVYKYTPVTGEVCSRFDVLGNEREYVVAAFASQDGTGEATIVRLDENGKPYYTATVPARDFLITAMETNIVNGSTIVTGHSPHDGGIVYKIRPEGDIVFAKTIVPAASDVKMDMLYIARTGNILVGGSGGGKGYYAMLRSDGTELTMSVVPGMVTGMGMNRSSDESVITSFDAINNRGTMNRISTKGTAEFEQLLDGIFDLVHVSANSEVLLVSTCEGRISIYSEIGERLSDRFVDGNSPSSFERSLKTASGEVIFGGMSNRIVKMAHGIYISDVKITKPVTGHSTALFTVTLTGYSTTPEGAPVPVNVSFETVEGTADTQNNFIPVSGHLSFSPSGGETNRFLVKQHIEVPIKANNLVEGVKEFEMMLSGVKNSYIIKSRGSAVIEDHQALVKLVRTEEGIEGEKDIVYEVGLFKTDGTPLYNRTGTEIYIDGRYGEGTADAMDYDMGFTPRTVIPDNGHTARFRVKTLEDRRYEMPKTVVVNFDKIYALSGTNIGFDGAMLSCTGTVVDQPAMLAITSLGDHRVNNNVVSGFFTVSLLRASDGALLTNATGSDIEVRCIVAESSTAREGVDFVLTNAHDLKIIGDGNHSAVNVNGVVLYNPSGEEPNVVMTIDGVTSPAGARPITISPDKKTAGFMIRK